MSTKRIRLVVAYDGTDFRGWAAQPRQRTVQGTLRETVRQISGEDCEITGASRTDSGAHARGQVCHFDSTVGIEPAKWSAILRRAAPLDLAVLASQQVASDFHSRFWAMDRWYRYRIGVGDRDPMESRYRYEVDRPLNVDLMAEAARKLVGCHDFRAFTEELEPEDNSERTLYRADVARVLGEVRIDVVGAAFARGMMRRISGALLEVGRGKRPVEEIERLLDPDRREDLQWPEVLPARGLTLMAVRYGRHPKDRTYGRTALGPEGGASPEKQETTADE